MDRTIDTIISRGSRRRRNSNRSESRARRRDFLCSSSSSSSSLWLIIICTSFGFFHAFLTLSLAQATLSDLLKLYNTSCGGDPVEDDSAFLSNQASLPNTFRTMSSSHLYYFDKTNYFSDNIQGFYQCRGDLTLDLCTSCVSRIVNSQNMRDCANLQSSKSFRADTGGCSLLYMSSTDNIISNSFTYLWSWFNNTSGMALSGFSAARDTLLNDLASKAPSETNLFASNKSVLAFNASVYALVQCFGILNSSQCHRCLALISSSSILDNATEGMIYYGSCFIRFSSLPFYSVMNASAASNTTSPSNSPKRERVMLHRKSAYNTLAIGLGLGLGLSSLLIITLLLVYRRQQINKGIQASESRKEDGLENRFHAFSITELNRATQNFHQGNIVGRGGFGHVYKGVLNNGEPIAVKKLAKVTNTAKSQFVAEVKFITSVKHRNLIRLRGYCTDSKERILVYEFLPNKSLDKHIFNADINARRMLSWRKRLDILMGTARGLAYMHHDCHQRIIHRDIKAANILLDESLNPKIADFGLARLFELEKSQLDTGVAGTLGYLAPEYFLNGQLTEKADVYSFGIVMLEVVSGRRIIDNDLDADETLLQWAWKLFKADRLSRLVDVALGQQYDMEEVIQVVSLALSCTQELSSARPSMNNVVAILGNHTQDMANRLPGQPGFIFETSWSLQSDDSNLLSPPISCGR